jgi:hypothetical protein
MKKEHILSEIKRTAKLNGGIPLGIRRFCRETGIRESDLCGVFWSKWSEALAEAGFSGNRLTAPVDEQLVLKAIADHTRELGHFPTKPEFGLLHQRDKNFPIMTTLTRRLGNRREIVLKVLEFCRSSDSWTDVIDICQQIQPALLKTVPSDDASDERAPEIGHVYLLKHGNEYKIGRSTDAVRRYKEIRTQMPYKTEEIHVIETDDPSGIEAYWHNRFREKKLEGEWFKLSAADVKAFKKRKFM